MSPLIKPYKLKKSIAAFKEALAFKGVSVVIAKETCTLFAKGQENAQAQAIHVSDKCKNHRLCIGS
jgi:indolepyruvate ferredoxin oxidoreductase alpha subunit